MSNYETEKNYICHSERAVATEESIPSVIPRRMTLGTPITSGSRNPSGIYFLCVPPLFTIHCSLYSVIPAKAGNPSGIYFLCVPPLFTIHCSLYSVIPAEAEITENHMRILFPGGSSEAKSLHAPLPVNSSLGTFTSGQTNADGVRHVPYLDWGAA